MKKIMFVLSLTVISVALLLGQSLATMPGETTNPNGFPSGAHYNLNIIGKTAGFTCPEQQLNDSGNPLYGNVVFVPETGVGIQIIMQSGKGPKAAAIPELQVIDACTIPFDNDAAVMQLPKNDAGYQVYARALAKPTDLPVMMKITPDLYSVQDEYGNDLLYLGLLTPTGFKTPYAEFTRPKGKSTAIDITGLFLWSGDVCYFTPSLCDEIGPGTCTASSFCCVPVDADLNGLYDDDVYADCSGPGELCPVGGVPVTTYCRTYLNEWVFNIGDFVEYLWNIDNTGTKLLQVRFYPN